MRAALRSLPLAAALLAAACTEPPPPVLDVPWGEVRTAHYAWCAPALTWTPGDGTRGGNAEAAGGWSFRGVADVPCWIERAPAEGLTFWAEAADDLYRFTWDDEPLDPPRPAAGGWEVDVPAERITPGPHSFAVFRRRAAGDRLSARLGAFGRVIDGERVPFDPARAADHAYFAEFVLQGSAGREGGDGAGDKMGGVLAVGPATLDLPLVPHRAGSRLAVDVENASRSPARLSWSGLDAGGAEAGVTLAAGERRRLVLTVGNGDAPPRLAVDGDPDGNVLFGVPRLLGTAPSDRPPLVLLVTLDTTRRDAVGAFGGGAGATPRIDDFAAHATVFERALSTSPWTLPSHVSMFTGLWASRHGVGVDEARFRPDLDTVASLLAGEGFVTAGFAGGGLMSQRFGGARGFGWYLDPERGERPGDELTDLALDFAADHGVSEHGGSPLFLFVNYFDPHWPYRPRQEWAERYGVPEAAEKLSHEAWRATAAGEVGPWRRITHDEVPATLDDMVWLRAAYHAEVAFMDSEVGRLFDGLRRLGLWDDALVAVVADHGEQLGEGGYYGHAYRLDPELVEVPLVVKWPRQRQGRRVEQLVSGVDLFPTLLAAAGVEPPASDGLPLSGDGDGDGHGRVYYEEHSNRFHALQIPRYRIAHHLWGLESASRRRVVWEAGESCAERTAAGWRAAECSGDRERVLAALRDLLGAPTGDAAVAGELAEEDRAMLKALGYL
ncbi:MAG TPA: sulfatase [Thermoanaerobaculia bacterium]|nr:sulfatase [Thermoanaerobaculia bacterium]